MSADRKATKTGSGNGLSQLLLLLEKLAERPKVIAPLMVAILAGIQPSVRADESPKLTLVSTNSISISSLTLTNSINQTPGISLADTNSISFSLSQSASKSDLPATILQSPGQDLSSVNVVIKSGPDSSGLFSGQSGNGSLGFANIQAGFGQVYDSDSIVLRGRNGTAWEETRYVFFKTVVKF